MTSPLYFVGGAYGTGKSSLCQQLASSRSCRWLTASTLIRHEPAVGDPTGKAVESVDHNQEKLLFALEPHRAYPGPILLDGHYCVLAGDGRIAPIPTSVFQRIRPDLLILVDAPAAVATARLKARDRAPMDDGVLALLLETELEHAHHISDAIGVPLVVITWPDGLQKIHSTIDDIENG